jgi:hypothetical protein
MLLHQLHLKEFRWFVHNDDNREENGKALREEFLDIHGQTEPDMPDAPASMLEILIVLSRMASYNSYGEPSEWFWKLIENLDLRNYTDAHFNHHLAEEVEVALEQVVNRSYMGDGRGGLFPLRYPQHDQRRVELWYQLSNYLLECEESGSWPYTS